MIDRTNDYLSKALQEKRGISEAEAQDILSEIQSQVTEYLYGTNSHYNQLTDLFADWLPEFSFYEIWYYFKYKAEEVMIN